MNCLVILLSFGPWIFSSLDTLSYAVGNPTHQVKGILGGSVLFFANGSEGITVEKIEWDFLLQRSGLGFWLGEFSHGKLEHPSPTDRFGQRLDMVDETTLRIKDLELDDSGIYNARIWFTKSQFQEQSFSLTVYEPLSHAVGSPPHQVNGILGGSVSFPANVSQGIIVKKIEWDFLPKYGGLGFRLGEYRHGKPDHPNPTDRFGERLDIANQKMLRIKDLELNDSGRYRARVWFTQVQFQEQSFSLTVYEPVPTPQIDHQVESKTPGGCNVSLRCHTPGREELNITWETGDLHRALGKSLNQYQVSDNGWDLRGFYWNNSFDSKFTCLVSNPVDQKRTSFDFLNICQSGEGGQFGPLSWGPWLIPSVIVLLVIMVMVMWMCWKIIFKRHRRGIHSVMQKKGYSTPTFQNSKMSNPEDGDDEVDSDREDFSSSSTLPRESFPSYAVSGTEPSEIEHCIPQTNMGDQAHLLQPLPRNSLKVPQGKDPLKTSQCHQLSRSYSLPSTFKHWPQDSCDQDREQRYHSYPLIADGVSLRARNLRKKQADEELSLK